MERKYYIAYCSNVCAHPTLFITRQQALQKEREITVLKENNESLGGQLMMVRNHSQLEKNDTRQDIDHLTQENVTLTEQIKELEDKLKLSKVPEMFMYCSFICFMKLIVIILKKQYEENMRIYQSNISMM